MIRREAFEDSLRNLSGIGFKILIDLFASSPKPLRARELPFEFRSRHAGESKFDAMIGIEYLMLLADKLVGHVVPVRFLMFVAVGSIGVVTHLATLWTGLGLAHLSFAAAQAARDRRRHGRQFHAQQYADLPRPAADGLEIRLRPRSFSLICGIGALANVGIAWCCLPTTRCGGSPGLAGAAMSAVWNYAATSALTWRQQ